MSGVFVFTPRQGVEAVKNVEGFVAGCMGLLHTFGRDLDFKLNQWDISKYITKRSKSGRVTFTFSNFDSSGSRTSWVPMSEPFLSFAKAKMRYDFGKKPNESHNPKMAAIRALEKALVESASDRIPRAENVNMHVLNLAANYLEEENPAGCYASGCHLERIATWMVKQQMTRVPFQWKNTISKREELLDKISPEADDYRLQNIPSMAAIKALPQLFANASDPRDILVSSVSALLFCAPGRFNEIFALPERCEHKDTRPDGSEIYGLRRYVSKGGTPEILKIIKTMEGICKDAVKKLREVTKEARKMAQWYEANPDKLYLPKGFEHLREKEYVLASELPELLGQADGGKVCRWAGEKGLTAIKVPNDKGKGAPSNAYRFEDIERVVCSMLPVKFPVYDAKTGLTYGKALFLVPKSFFHSVRSPWLCMFEEVDIDTFNDQLGSGSKHGKSSIFSRNGYNEEDDNDTPINLDSNDFRHYLSYLAKRKGVDQLVLALWSGRKNISENKNYGDLLTAEKTKILREGGVDVAESLGLIGFDVNDPECGLLFGDIRTVLELQYQFVHETQYGYCVHDYSRTPCERRMQCLECTDHLCVKGECTKNDRVRTELSVAENSLEHLEKGIADGEHVAGTKLHKFLTKTVSVRKQLVKLLDDRNLETGTRIQMDIGADTSLDIAVVNRIALGGTDGNLLAAASRIRPTIETRNLMLSETVA
ncbi:DNA-binding protein [Geomonas sp. Red276]